MPTPAEFKAEAVLDTFFGNNPRQYPIDPVIIARELGINVWRGQYENAISGALVKASPNHGVDMFINEGHAPVRQRFTAAHELGHYFRVQEEPARARGPYHFERAHLAACGTDEDEIFANGFAAALLAPASEVRRLSEIGFTPQQMAARFQISLDSMNIRINNVLGS